MITKEQPRLQRTGRGENAIGIDVQCVKLDKKKVKDSLTSIDCDYAYRVIPCQINQFFAKFARPSSIRFRLNLAHFQIMLEKNSPLPKHFSRPIGLCTRARKHAHPNASAGTRSHEETNCKINVYKILVILKMSKGPRGLLYRNDSNGVGGNIVVTRAYLNAVHACLN